MIPTTTLADGTRLPLLGQGTGHMGDDPSTRAAESEALRIGIARGMTLIDTAEKYGSGRSENVVGEAIAPVRDEVCLVDKVLLNPTRGGTELELTPVDLAAIDSAFPVPVSPTPLEVI